MSNVTIELWVWFGKDLKEDFRPISEICFVREEEIREGTTVRQLLKDLAKRYQSIAENVFDMRTNCLHPHMLLTYNDKIINLNTVYEKVLQGGDKIKILPLIGGG